MKKIFVIIVSFCVSLHLISAASFEDVRAAAGVKGSVLPENTFIEGIIINDFSSFNNAPGVNVKWNQVDISDNFKTGYVQSLDGKYGFKLVFNGVYDFRMPLFSRVKIDLSGALVEPVEPAGYVISGLDNECYEILAENVAVSPKIRRISELTDDDVFTYVVIPDVELSAKEGAYTNVFEPAMLKGKYNHWKKPVESVDTWAAMLKDSEGNSIYMPVNALCEWRRNMKRVPQGVGEVEGVVVSEVLRRYGDIGRYAIRVRDDSAIRISREKSSNYSVIAEWNWDYNYDAALDTESHGPVEWVKEPLRADRIRSEVGDGWLYTTAGAGMSLAPEYNSYCAMSGVGGEWGHGQRSWGALRLHSDAASWYILDKSGKVTGRNSIVVEASTKGFSGTALTLDFTWVAGNLSADMSWGYPAEWIVEFSMDGRNFAPVKKIIDLRPLYFKNVKVPSLGNRNVPYDAAAGFTEVSVKLPAFLLDKEKVYFRISPATDRLVVLGENPAEDIKSGKMLEGFLHDFILNIGKVSLKVTR